MLAEGSPVLSPTYPALRDREPSKVCRIIHDHLRLFVEEERYLTSALVHNPFGPTPEEDIAERYGAGVAETIGVLNRLHAHDETVLELNGKARNAILLYLLDFKFSFKLRGRYAEIHNLLTPENVRFASALLDRFDIKEVRASLEDKFFAFLHPDLYAKYRTQLALIRRKYLANRKEIMENFAQLLGQSGMAVEIQERLKTISSIHKKVTKKNILVAQVLDTIGIRVIVEGKDECYRAMWLILKEYPSMTNRIKDYISIPKSNGYQSIHLTILHDGHPVEIQIRTREMHALAQYGKAAHLRYKRYGR